MQHVASIIGHLAWPLVALIIAYWLVRELRSGLLSSLLPHGGTLKAAGIELEVKAAGAALAAAGVEKTMPQPGENRTIELIEDETPYDVIIKSWREVSGLIADLAARHGGRRDARYTYNNLDTLTATGAISAEIADAARALFRARNSARRLPPEEVTQDDAYAFAVNAGSLAAYLKDVKQ
ncbi:hypothetical protein ATU3B_04370 [Agrobacterium genomosp. 3 str. CIP 111-78]|uniref:Uncharacterized protein n=1 Tax=Agrobacterium tumefaciens TaxID=358 RepID=A0AAE6BS68_AGRTU|nr:MULTISPECIES: hypothetical protein [Agrobacterium]MCA2370851.1 hypothetical protein [Agrobacterium tomkonis CIP 111-78]QCM02607.1 hypothetical protein CFBP6624_20805 [Agrobacterium tumefaciens]RRN68288.1 hypothetical protein EIQ31_20545 [Agrobacterium deltaense]